MSGILILTVDPAWPPVSGAQHRNWQIAKAAALHGPVRLLSVTGPAEHGGQPYPGISIAALSQEPSAKIDRRPWSGSLIDLTLPPDIGRLLAIEIQNMNPDYVIFEHLGLHPLLEGRARGTARWIFDFHNVESDLAVQKLNRWTIPGMRWWQGSKIRAIERRVSRQVDGIWTCSSIDAGRVGGLCPSSPAPQIVPNGIPRLELAPQHLLPHDTAADGPNLLFLGYLCWSPNIVAAEVLATKILPLLRQKLPSARLTLAGRDPGRRINRLRGNAVTVVANPADVVPLLKSADIVVVPLLAGSGTRIKIIEAMAWGIPVVATKLAVEGLDLTEGVDVRLAETPSEFVAAIISLTTDRARYAAQREAAHAHAFRRFGPAAVSEAVTAGLMHAAHAPLNA